MRFKKQPKEENEVQVEFLHKKWGFVNSAINASLEKTHQALLQMYVDIQDRFQGKQAEHFQSKLNWEHIWRKRKEERYLN